MVRIHPDPPTEPPGAIAQLGERLLCKQEVTGSIPVGSTRFDAGCSAKRLSHEARFAVHFVFRLLFNNSEETRRVRHSFKGRTHWVRDCIRSIEAAA